MSNFVGYGYKAAKTPFGKKVVQKVTKFFKPKGNKTPSTITAVKPGTKLTEKRKAQDEFVKSRDKILKGTSPTTKTEIKTKNPLTNLKKRVKDILTPDELAKGGRVGLKRGTGLRRKTNVEKIKKAFGPKEKPQTRMTRKKKKFPDLTGDGKVTFADILKGRGVINGKKKKKVI